MLGILFDSVTWSMSLPPDKLDALHSTQHSWSRRTTCTKRDLLSLIGCLAFAAKVVPPGRTFLHRLIDLSTTAQSLDETIHLSESTQGDIAWWQSFLQEWNGRATIPDWNWTRSPDFELFIDAAAAYGYRAHFQDHWMAEQWLPPQAELSLTWKELFPIALACQVWGPMASEEAAGLLRQRCSHLDYGHRHLP